MISSLPYPGLRPFQTEEAHIFFGREEQTDELLERLAETHFLAVVGPSGCGKSSLVRAGMIAGLETGFVVSAGSRWRVATLRPGNHPLQRLAEALVDESALGARDCGADAAAFTYAILRRGPKGLIELLEEQPLEEGTNLLLLVDQFEEIFRYREGRLSDESDAFVALLLETAQRRDVPVYVVLTMRSDYLGDCALFPGLPEALNESQYLTPRLTRDQRREAIVGPARVFGGDIEPKLIARLLNEMGADPDQLPLMQHLLMRMWTQKGATAAGGGERRGHVLTLADYERAGGLDDALSIHADEAYLELDPGEKAIAEVMFRSLTERDIEQRDTRRPVPVAEMAAAAGVSPEAVIEVAEHFRRRERSFMTPAAGETLYPTTTLDISHESLIRCWSRLSRWVESEADKAWNYRRLEEDACLWSDGKVGLWRTPELERGLAWRDNERPTAEWARRYGRDFDLAMKFLDESERARQAHIEAKEAARRREVRRLRIWSATLGLAAVVMAILALFYLRENREANRRQELVIAARDTIYDQRNALEVRNQALDSANRMLAANYASLEATNQQLIDLADSARRASVTAHAHEIAAAAHKNIYEQDDAERTLLLALHSLSLTYGHDGSYAPIAGDALQRAVQTSRALLTLPGHSAYVTAVAFSPSGDRLASAGADHLARVWDRASGREQVSLVGHTGWVQDVAFSADGALLVTGSEDGTIGLWNSRTGGLLRAFRGHGGMVYAVDISPDGTRLVSGGSDSTAIVWDAYSGESLRVYAGHRGQVWDVAFSPDGERVVSAGTDSYVNVWEATTGEAVRTLYGHANDVYAVAFSPDGRRVASGGQDQTVRVWEVSTGLEIANHAGHTNTVFGVDFLADDTDTLVVSASADRTIRVWGDPAEGERLVLTGHSGPVPAVDVAANGEQIASGGADGQVKVWESSPEEDLLMLTGHAAEVWGLAFDSAGGRIATADMAGRWTIWDAKRGRPALTSTGHTGAIIAVDARGSLVASAGTDGTVRLWNADRGELQAVLAGHTDWVRDVEISPDGRYVATASDDRTARIWYASRGEVRHVLNGHTLWVRDVAFSPNGERLATASNDGTIRIWDTTTGAELRSLDHGDWVLAVTFDPGGRRLASGGLSGVARLWDVESGALLDSLPGDRGPVRDVEFDPSGARLVTAPQYGGAKIWELAPRARVVNTVGGNAPANRIEFGPDGTTLLTAHPDGSVKIWDLGAGTTRLDVQAHGVGVEDASFGHDGRTIVSAGSDNRLKLWDAATGDQRRVLSAGHGGGIRSVAFSRDGTRMATAGTDGAVIVWDAASGESQLTLAANPGGANAVAFSPDGSRLVSAGQDNALWVWDATRGVVEQVLTGHTDPILSVEFAPDGRRVASASMDSTVRVWDLESNEGPLVLTGHGSWVTDVTFDGTGTRLATGSQDGTARLWDLARGEEIFRLVGHSDAVRGVAFSPDGQRLATVSFDKTAKVWDTRTGEEQLALSGHTRWVLGVEFSPDGRHIATSGSDGRVILFPSTLEQFLELGWPHITRSLRSEECQRFLRESECPSTVASLVLEGQELARNGQPQAAEQRFAAALEQLPPFGLDPGREARWLAAASLEAEGRHLAWSGDVEGAAERFERAARLDAALELDPRRAATALAVENLVSQGRYLAMAGAVEMAVSTFREAAEASGAGLGFEPEAEAERLAAIQAADIAYRRAIGEDQIEVYRTALEAHDRALAAEMGDTLAERLTRHRARLSFELGRSQWEQGELPAARAALERARAPLRWASDDSLEARVDLYLGQVLYDQGDLEAAAEIWRDGAALVTNMERRLQSWLLNNLAWVYSLRGERLDEAASLVERAIEVGGRQAAYLDTKAWVLFRQGEGRCFEALSAIVEARDLNGGGTDPEIDAHYVEIQCVCGTREAAQRALDDWDPLPQPVAAAYGSCRKVRLGSEADDGDVSVVGTQVDVSGACAQRARYRGARRHLTLQRQIDHADLTVPHLGRQLGRRRRRDRQLDVPVHGPDVDEVARR